MQNNAKSDTINQPMGNPPAYEYVAGSAYLCSLALRIASDGYDLHRFLASSSRQTFRGKVIYATPAAPTSGSVIWRYSARSLHHRVSLSGPPHRPTDFVPPPTGRTRYDLSSAG